jgi:hypothetical protein
MVHFHAGQQVDIHLWLIETETPPSPVFDQVHGGFGAFDQIIQTWAIFGVQGNANAATDGKTQLFDQEWPGHDLKNSMRQNFCPMGINILQKHHELITTESTQGINIAQTAFDTLCNLNKNAVTKRMAHRIIDIFKAVKVEIEDAKLAARPLGHAKRIINPL